MEKNQIAITGKVYIVDWLPRSKNGNPKALCLIVDENGDGTSFRTKTDSDLGYAIGNYRDEYATVKITWKPSTSRWELDSISVA